MADEIPDVRVGFFFDGDDSTPNVAAMLRVEDGRTLLEIPLADGITDPFTKPESVDGGLKGGVLIM